MSMKMVATTDIAVIGAGASGMVAALRACENGKRVTLIEGSDRIGKKILSTGNGKCNLSHTSIKTTDYHGSGKTFIEDIFADFGTNETIEYFKKLGMLTRNRDGYIYPYSEQASTVLDILRFAIDKTNIELLTSTKITNIKKNPENNKYAIYSGEMHILWADRVIVTTGGCAAPGTGSDGSGFELAKRLNHKVTPIFPALVKVKSSSSVCKGIDGVRAKGLASLYVNRQDINISDFGEIQFTKDGLSGIPIFNLSGQIAQLLADKKEVVVLIDLFPDYTLDELIEYINYKFSISNSAAEESLCGLINKKLCIAVMKIAGISPQDKTDSIPVSKIHKFAKCCKEFSFSIIGTYGFEQAQVSAGGVSFSDLNKHLESTINNGLFFAGEVLDIDGICGGYNLQWAWSSGFVAGKYASEY